MGEEATAKGQGRLRGAAAVRLHLALGAGLAICISAFVIEVARALGGNTLSWAYVFEWPVLGGFGIYMWWKLFNQTDTARRRTEKPVDPADAEALERWNRYLAELAEQDRVAQDPAAQEQADGSESAT